MRLCRDSVIIVSDSTFLYHKNNKQVFDVLFNYFIKVFNQCIIADYEYINSIPRCPIFYEISRLMAIQKLSESLFCLIWYKALGQNTMSPNAVKALDLAHRYKLLKFINLWLNDNISYPEWLVTCIKVLPKKGNLLDPNN